jgi:hypothetical protein
MINILSFTPVVPKVYASAIAHDKFQMACNMYALRTYVLQFHSACPWIRVPGMALFSTAFIQWPNRAYPETCSENYSARQVVWWEPEDLEAAYAYWKKRTRCPCVFTRKFIVILQANYLSFCPNQLTMSTILDTLETFGFLNHILNDF